VADKQLLEILYFQVTDLWKRLCEKHNQLYDVTCDEYSYLLDSNIEKLESSVREKQDLISEIGELENIRREIISEINNHIPSGKIKTVTDLLNLMQDFEETSGQNHLCRFNQLLINIIEKIQAQNKKNQMFINKALLTLKEIREEATGKKSYATYTANGATTKSTSDFFIRR